MVSLSPQLHVWWGKVYFGLKCLGILPTDKPNEALVRVQFFWMPKVTTLWRRDDRDVEKLQHYVTNEQSPFADKGVAALRLSGRPVKTGDVFDIPVAKNDARKMKMAVDLQWALTLIASMSGAADVDVTGFPPDDGPPDEAFVQRRLRNWVEHSPSFPHPPKETPLPEETPSQMFKSVVRTASPTKSTGKDLATTQPLAQRLTFSTRTNQKENQKP